MTIDDCYQLGYVIKPHGLKGELQVFLDVDNPQQYTNLESVFVLQGQQLVPFFIEYISVKGTKAIVAFDEIQSIEEAKPLKSKELYLPLANLPEAGEDAFYLHEIEGFKVVDQHRVHIGLIKNAVESGPQVILVIHNEDEQEILVPYTSALLIKIDRETQELQLEVPDGLIDIYTSESNED